MMHSFLDRFVSDTVCIQSSHVQHRTVRFVRPTASSRLVPFSARFIPLQSPLHPIVAVTSLRFIGLIVLISVISAIMLEKASQLMKHAMRPKYGDSIWTPSMGSFYQMHARNIDGQDVPFSNYDGRVTLVMNTACGCGEYF